MYVSAILNEIHKRISWFVVKLNTDSSIFNLKNKNILYPKLTIIYNI
jgi:hypothetical protein